MVEGRMYNAQRQKWLLLPSYNLIPRFTGPIVQHRVMKPGSHNAHIIRREITHHIADTINQVKGGCFLHCNIESQAHSRFPIDSMILCFVRVYTLLILE